MGTADSPAESSPRADALYMVHEIRHLINDFYGGCGCFGRSYGVSDVSMNDMQRLGLLRARENVMRALDNLLRVVVGGETREEYEMNPMCAVCWCIESIHAEFHCRECLKPHEFEMLSYTDACVEGVV